MPNFNRAAGIQCSAEAAAEQVRDLQFIAAAKEHRRADRLSLTVLHLDIDQGVAARAALYGLLGNLNLAAVGRESG